MNTDKEIVIGKYKVKVLRDDCIGAASCIVVSPNVFTLDKEGKAVIVENGKDLEENILQAAQSCPTKAVVITDATTGEKVWPK